ncbi:hypothetical protein BV25DRAFT_991176 [Artomyces pyxidatus]|uniref:Uncharacterized protein n=1 Tax=Artomyces pyxidatus TaxID=48021 RepID=A0ACB8SVN8_9AGAM|nr:hypothetical protein BV25DRAFT_991176 [Artomyces pyxidatus]
MNLVFQVVVTYISLAEAAASMAQAYPSSTWSESVSQFLTGAKGKTLAVYTSPIFVAGVATTFLGMVIRVMCFRELGKFFTYELAIRDKHKLVTSGPYSIVRHPSYTGLALVYVGITCSALAEGMWWTEYGVQQTLAGWALWVSWWVVLIYTSFIGFRARKEDDMLHIEFGEEWEVYAKRVPCRYIPWLL